MNLLPAIAAANSRRTLYIILKMTHCFAKPYEDYGLSTEILVYIKAEIIKCNLLKSINHVTIINNEITIR